MLRAFTVGFLESFKSCLLFLVALPGLIDTLAQLLACRSLLWLSMTWRQMFLTQKYFLSTTSLAWSVALHLLVYSDKRSLRVEGNRHTHTHEIIKHILRKCKNCCNTIFSCIWSLIYFSLNEIHENNRKTSHLSLNLETRVKAFFFFMFLMKNSKINTDVTNMLHKANLILF